MDIILKKNLNIREIAEYLHMLYVQRQDYIILYGIGFYIKNREFYLKKINKKMKISKIESQRLYIKVFMFTEESLKAAINNSVFILSNLSIFKYLKIYSFI